MKFQTEIELVNLLKDTLIDNYGNENIEIFKEVSLGYGIADIVVTRLIKPRKKLKSSKVILNNFDINIFSLIRKTGKISIDTIINTTRCSKKEILISLEKLVSNKYVKIKSGSLFVNKEYELTFSTNFAIEAN